MKQEGSADQQDPWIVFDLIGVLAEPSWREITRSTDLEAWDALKRGLKSERDFWDEDHADFYRSLLAFRPDRLRYLERLKQRGFQICVATNFHEEWTNPLKKALPDPDLVTTWIVSSTEGVAKPDAAFWERVLRTVPAGTVMVDDRRENCEAAERAGLRCVWAHAAARLEEEVERRLAESSPHSASR